MRAGRGENDAGGDGPTGIVGETMRCLNTATHTHAAPCPIERTSMRHSASWQATGVVSNGCKSVACFREDNDFWSLLESGEGCLSGCWDPWILGFRMIL